MTKNDELRERHDINGSTTVVLNFREMVELIHVIDGGDEPDPYHFRRARAKLIDARNHVVKRGRR